MMLPLHIWRIYAISSQMLGMGLMSYRRALEKKRARRRNKGDSDSDDDEEETLRLAEAEESIREGRLPQTTFSHLTISVSEGVNKI